MRPIAAFLTGFSTVEARVGYKGFAMLLLVIFTAAALLEVSLGAAPITGPWDVMALLDGGWRIVNGQVPHTDFHNPIGPLPSLLIAFGMEIAAPSTSSIVYGSVLLLSLLIPWAWRIGATRLSAPMAFLWALFVGFLLISPRPLGYAIRETTYAMIYNRQCYVLLAMFLLCLFLPRRESTRWSVVIDGLSIGLLAGLMFYDKITYAAAAGASLVLMFLLERPRATWLVSAWVGFLTVGGIFYGIFHVSPLLYISDFAAAGHSQSASMRIRLLVTGVENNLLWIYLLLVCLVFWTHVDRGGDASALARLRAWLVTAWIVAVALGISTGNAAQRGGADDPLFFVAGLIAIEWYQRRDGRSSPAPTPSARLVRGVSLAIVVPVFCGVVLARDVATVAYASAWDVMRRPAIDASRRMHSRPLGDFLVPAGTNHLTAYWPSRDHPAKINEGIDLIRRHLSPGDRITAIAFTNPFSFALGLPPAHDACQWWELNMSFDERHHPRAEDVLANSTLVIVPRLTDRDQGWSFETVDAMLSLYGEYLNSHFEQIDSSASWTLYRRR